MAEQNKKQKKKPDSEQQRIKKEEQARNARRRNRQLIGFALVILVVVGAVSIVRASITLVGNLMSNEEDIAAYQKRFEPLVWFDILPFDSVSQVDENTIKQVAIWGVINEKGDAITRNENGEPLISQAEVDQYGVQLFGPDFRFHVHEQFTDLVSGLVYRFDEENKMYIAPVTSLQPEYYATVVEIVRESGGVRRVVMGYVSTRTSDDQLIPNLDYDHPTRYMDFMLRRDGSEYYLYAIQNNTTHIPETPQPTSTPQSESLPDSSLPPVASSDSSLGQDDSAASDASGDGDGSAGAEDDSDASSSEAA